MYCNATSSFLAIHSKFLKDVYDGSKLYESTVSAIPTVIFLISSFVLVYENFHRYTRRMTSWKSFVCREFGLQSTFFYLTRFWFVIMKLFKWMSTYFENYVETISQPMEVYFNKLFTKFCLFSILTCVSLIPPTIMVIQYCFKENIMPNFLRWAAENRFLRSEMGAAGQLLETAPRLTVPLKRNNTNIPRRTASAEASIWGIESSRVCDADSTRNCRSMVNLIT
ncbi:hypothetical protein HHI36_019236 [Cryptolaemus montrouzieri]|uniref:Anoctamin n=1 Tax=Cryptolaemus montrouzieri TaxID=559131 RepID=A0ABD2P2E9_9CUCU